MGMTMFSIKFDLFFPTLMMAKKLARQLNARQAPQSDVDPRQTQRMRDELWAAHEAVKQKALQHRYHVF
jgi:hypothetical protein